MTAFVASEYSSLLVWELGRVALLVALAAVCVALLFKAVRSNSPKIQRLAWCAVLLQGWLLVRLPVAVPWYEAQSPALPGSNQGPGDMNSLSLDAKAQGQGDLIPLSLDGREQGEGDLNSLSLDGRGRGEGGSESVAASSAQPPPLADLSETRSSLATDGSLGIPLSLEGRGQSEADLNPLSLKGRGRGEGENANVSNAQPIDAESLETATAPSPLSWLTTSISRFAPTILSLWFAGIFGCIALWLFGYARFLRRLPASQPADAAWLEQWRELLAKHGVRRAIPLRVTGELGPLLCRRLRGYELLVPASLWRDLTQSQRAAILRHELAHYRRADVWKSLAARVLALPQWFNPLAWLAVRQFDEAAEWACDQAATAGQPRATDYARALVRLGESATRQASYSPAAHGRTLAVRVRRLLSPGTQEDSVMKKTLMIAAALALVAVGLVRLELVAREPADEDSIATEAKQASTDEDQLAPTIKPQLAGEAQDKQIRDLLALATNAAQDSQTKLDKGNYRAAAEAAGKAFEAFKAAYETDSATLADLCTWSQKWLEAERRSANSDKKEDVAAIEAYLARMQHIHDKVKALFGAGARGGEAEKYYSMVFYVEEAKEMLKAARERAKTDEAKAAEQTASPNQNPLNSKKFPYPLTIVSPGTHAAPTTPEDRRAVIDRKLAEDRRLTEIKMKAYSAAKELDIAAAAAGGKDPNATKRLQAQLEGLKALIESRKAQLEQEYVDSAIAGKEADDSDAEKRVETVKRRLSEDRQLQEMTDYLDSLELEAADEEKRSKHPAAGKRQRAQMKGVTEAIEKRKAQIEQKFKEEATREDQAERDRRANVGKDPRSLRFDGRTFDQWREELLTELKPERRTEAIRAFHAFAVNGLSREATQAIVDVMRGYDVWTLDNSAEGKLKQAAISAFRTIDRADAVPVLVEALKTGNANQRQFAARILWTEIPGETTAAPTLVAAIADNASKVRQSAISAMTRFSPLPDGAVKALVAATRDADPGVRGNAIGALANPDARCNEAAQAMIVAVGNSEPEIRQAAIAGLAQYDPRPVGLIPALRKALSDAEPQVVIAAIQALVPPIQNNGPGMMGGGAMGSGIGGAMGTGGGRFGGPGAGGGMGMRMGGGLASGPMDGTPGGLGRPPGAGRFGGGGAMPQEVARPEPIYVPEFLDLRQHENLEILNAAIDAMSILGPKCKPALPTALAWLRDDDIKKRQVSFGVLATIGPEAKEAVPALIKLLENPQTQPNETVWAIQTLGAIGSASAEAVPAIEKAAELLNRRGPDFPPGFGGAAQDQIREALDKIRKPPESAKPKDTPDPKAQSAAKGGTQKRQVSALIQVKAAPSTLPGTQRPDPFEVNAFRQTQIEHMKGPTIIRRALREPGIAQLPIVKEQADPVQWLQKALVAQYEGDSEKLRVQLPGAPADEASKIVNAVVKAYFDEHVTAAGQIQKTDRDALQATINADAASIGKLRTKKQALNSRVTQLINEMSTLRNQVIVEGSHAAAAAIEILDLETRLKIEKDPNKREAYIASKLADDRDLKLMKNSLDALETKAVAAEKNSKSPDAGKQPRERMKAMEEAIVKRKSQLEKELSESILDAKSADLQRSLDAAKEKKRVFENQLEESKKNFESRMKSLNDLKVATSVEIDKLTESLTQHEASRATMLAQLEAKKREADAPARVVLLERAQPPAGAQAPDSKTQEPVKK